MKKLILILTIIFLGVRTNAQERERIQINYPDIPVDLKGLGYSCGNLNSETVLINVQGGPVLKLNTSFFEKKALELNGKIGDYFWININQAQMLNTDKYRSENLSFEEAKEDATRSVEILAEIVQFFKSQKKKVYIIGDSFGGYLIADFISTYGNIAEGYLIMMSRLDLNNEMWKRRLNGEVWRFNNDAKTLYKAEPRKTILEKNIDMLSVAVAYKRYTKELEGIDLSNVIYLYGKSDDKAGALLKHEIDFLKSNGALLITSNGDHSYSRKYRETLIKLMLLD